VHPARQTRSGGADAAAAAEAAAAAAAAAAEAAEAAAVFAGVCDERLLPLQLRLALV
jgi:hypothetical protein